MDPREEGTSFKNHNSLSI